MPLAKGVSNAGETMTEYRVYLLGGDGKIVWATWVVAKHLNAAIAVVREEFDGVCEIWDGFNRLAVVKPVPLQQPLLQETRP